jgi:hypothetical protein
MIVIVKADANKFPRMTYAASYAHAFIDQRQRPRVQCLEKVDCFRVNGPRTQVIYYTAKIPNLPIGVEQAWPFLSFFPKS